MDLTKPFISAFQTYTDQFGMVQLGSDGTKGTVSDNGNLWTAFYVLGLAKNLEQIPQVEKVRLEAVYMNNFKTFGLLTRYPGSPDFEAQDDHCGIMMADCLLDPDRNFTKEIYNYGLISKVNGVDPREPVAATRKKNWWLYHALNILSLGHIKWNWNPVVPNSLSIYSWLGRRMELIAAIQMSARKSINPFYWLYWAIVMLTTSDSVGYVLHYCNAVSCKGYGKLTDWVCKKLVEKMVKTYGNVGNMFGQSNGQVNHPLVSYLSNVKGN
jgi:hypothetical protein